MSLDSVSGRLLFSIVQSRLEGVSCGLCVLKTKGVLVIHTRPSKECLLATMI